MQLIFENGKGNHMKVIKRSGEEVLFDANKIKKAVQKANEATEVHHQAGEEVIQQIR